MRVIVSGALGFIGSHVCEALVDHGHHVIGVDDHSGHVVDHIPGVTVIPERVQNVTLTNLHPNLIIHCASPVGAVGLLSLAGHIVPEIVSASYNVAHAAQQAGCPLINISSSEVYGFSGTYRETDDLRVPAKHSPRLEYAVGKMAAEHQVIGTPGLRSLTVRPFNVAGPRQTMSKGFVIPTFVEQALAGEPLTVFGDGTQQRSFTAVHDVVDFILAVKPEQCDGRVVNVGNPQNRCTINHLAERVVALLGSPSSIEHTTGKRVHGPAYEEAEGHVKVPDHTRAQQMGWNPTVGLDDLILRTASEYRMVTA